MALSLVSLGLKSQVLFVGLFVLTSPLYVLVVGPKRTGIKLFTLWLGYRLVTTHGRDLIKLYRIKLS